MRALLFLALSLFILVESQSPPPCVNQQNLYVLGDSLSSIDPNSAIYDGLRHTNGPTWNEYLMSQYMAAQTLLNVAAPGAVAYPAYREVPVPPCEEHNKYLSLQVTSLLNQTGGTIPPNTCIAIWIGANDINNVSMSVLMQTVSMQTVLENIQDAVLQALNTLIAAGGKCFWMFNQFPFQAYPSNSQLPNEAFNQLPYLSMVYNTAFANILHNQTYPAGVFVHVIDAAGALINVTTNLTYAHWNSTQCASHLPKCDAMNFSCHNNFWLDGHHPTTAGHQALAGEFFHQMQGFICPPVPVLPDNATDAEKLAYIQEKYGLPTVGPVNSVSSMTDAQRQALVQSITATETIVFTTMVISFIKVADQASGFTMSLPSNGGSGVTSLSVSDFGAGVVACVLQGLPATTAGLATAGLITPTINAGESLSFVTNVDRLDSVGNIIHTVPFLFGVPRNGKGMLRVYTHTCNSSTCNNIPGVNDGQVTTADVQFSVTLSHTSGVTGVSASTVSPSPMDNGPGSSAGLYGLFALLILPFIAIALFWWGWKQLKKPAKAEARNGPVDPYGMPMGYSYGGVPMSVAPQPMEFVSIPLGYDKPVSTWAAAPAYMPSSYLP